MSWEILLADTHRAPDFDELHARIDNYQVYSLVIFDQKIESTFTYLANGVSFPSGSGISYTEGNAVYHPDISIYNKAPSRTTLNNSIETIGAINCIAYQSYSPMGKIMLDFADIFRKYPPHTIDSRSYRSRGAFYGVDITRQWVDYLTAEKSDYKSLLFGDKNDTRTIPEQVNCRAASTRLIEVWYYRRNLLETHPRIEATYDWFKIELEVIANEQYTLLLPSGCLGGVYCPDDQTKAEIIAGFVSVNNYLSKYLFLENVADLFVYWDSLHAAPAPPQPRPIGSTYHLPGEINWVIPDADSWVETSWEYYWRGVESEGVRSIIESRYTPLVRVMAANNDRWNHGTISTSQNRPPNDHYLFDFDHQKLFEELQLDGSYGTYMTDSTRLIELHAAVAASTYATYTNAAGQTVPRVANLGWMVEKIAAVLGIRRTPGGKFLDKKEQEKYQRNRLNSPKWNQGDYDLNSWGNRGYALRHVPTAFEGGQRQDNQYDLVHDMPQLFAAVLDQIDRGQGLQHTAEIRLKVGDRVQAYANVGQLTIDLAARVIEMESLLQKVAVMQVETSNSVRELFPGIGIAVTTKAAFISIGGKKMQILYPAFQSGKGSILDTLSSLKVNVGIILGQLMPQKKNDVRWNPFDRKPPGK